MKKFKIRCIWMAVIFTPFLYACGGGGSSGTASGGTATVGPTSPPPGTPVSPPPAQPVSNVKLADPSNGFANAKTAYSATFLVGSDIASTFAALVTEAVGADYANIDFTTPQTGACQAGGTETLTLTDADGSKSLSAGDTVNITYDHCIESAAAGTPSYTGSVAVTINALTGNSQQSPFSQKTHLVTTQFVVAYSNGASATVSGTVDEQLDLVGSADTAKVTLINATVNTALASGNDTAIQIPNFVVTANEDSSTSTPFFGYTYDGSLAVTYNKGASQLYLTVATATPLDDDNYFPGTGAITLTSGDETAFSAYTEAFTQATGSVSTINITGAATVTASMSDIHQILIGQ